MLEATECNQICTVVQRYTTSIWVCRVKVSTKKEIGLTNEGIAKITIMECCDKCCVQQFSIVEWKN